MVGAMAGVAVLNLGFGAAYMPVQAKFLVQILAGAFIACSVEKSDLVRLPHILKPALILFLSLLLLNLAAGSLIFLAGPLDLITSMMSAVPGGLSNAAIIADAMGADTPRVIIMQMVRQILGIGVFPGMILLYDRVRCRRGINPAPESPLSAPSSTSSGASSGGIAADGKKHAPAAWGNWKTLACTLLTAALAGGLGRELGVPAGGLIFSLLAVLILKIALDFAYFPRMLRRGTQILNGCYFGSLLVLQDLLAIPALIVPMLILILGYTLNCFITGRVIAGCCGFTRKEAMLIATPAGASDMALISADLGVHNTDVLILQVLRVLFVTLIFPPLINLVILYAGTL